MILIDAMPIKKFIENGLNCKDLLKAFGHDAIEILTEIEFAPVVDAVDVVRCKDCECWKHEYDDEGLCLTDVAPIDGDFGGVPRLAMDFCSYGERRV